AAQAALVQKPRQLRGGEVRIENQTGERGYAAARGCERRTPGRRATVLPHDCPCGRRSRISIPEQHRLALVGDADGIRHHARFGDCLVRSDDRAAEDLLGIVLNPSGSRKVLRQLSIAARDHAPLLGDDEAGAAGGAVVDRGGVAHWGWSGLGRVVSVGRWFTPAALAAGVLRPAFSAPENERPGIV